MAKVVKKVDPKKVAKEKVMEIVMKALTDAGYTVEGGEDFGFTAGTAVVHADKCDVQIKPITPKAGVDRYDKLEDEDETVEVAKEPAEKVEQE